MYNNNSRISVPLFCVISEYILAFTPWFGTAGQFSGIRLGRDYACNVIREAWEGGRREVRDADLLQRAASCDPCSDELNEQIERTPFLAVRLRLPRVEISTQKGQRSEVR